MCEACIMVFLFDAGIRAGMAGIIGMLAGGVTALCSAPLSVTASTDENDSQRSGQHLYWKLNSLTKIETTDVYVTLKLAGTKN